MNKEYEELIEELRRPHADCDPWALMNQAADAIEGLQSVVEHYAEVCVTEIPRWIPVTERLPKEGEFVLVYGDLYPNKHDGGVIAVSKRMDYNYWQGFGRERNITHWMWLPEPPKEVKK